MSNFFFSRLVLLFLLYCSVESAWKRVPRRKHHYQVQHSPKNVVHNVVKNITISDRKPSKLPEGSNLKNKSFVAACLIIKDEGEYLPEWIEYHQRLGVSKFYVIDHFSVIPVLPFIQEYVRSGLVDYFLMDFPSHHERDPQVAAYASCLDLHRNHHQFIAFIDADEFIVVVNKSRSLVDELQDFKAYGGVALNWMMFGSSGHVNRPKGGVIENYQYCYRDYLVKNIVNTDYVMNGHHDFKQPHVFKYAQDHYAVTPDGKPIYVALNKNLDSAYNRMYINHYHTKSYEEFMNKMKRGNGALYNPDPKHVFSDIYFEKINNKSKDLCPTLVMPLSL